MTKRLLLGFLALMALLVSTFALNVDEAEISTAEGRSIEFINYVGPHDRIDSAEEIREIGRAMGKAIAAGALRAGEAGRYLIIHAVDPSLKEGLDADILVVGEGALVDHVRNLRRIIGGYLEIAYGYTPADADTLALFATIYNAVYRGNMAYFGTKYKSVVTREINERNAGMSVRWDEWAGRSRIVIPLTARAGKAVIGSVDTTSITDAPTIDSLRTESPTGGLDERRDIVDIKERDVDQQKAALEAERARIVAEEKALAEEKARVEASRAAATPASTPGTTTTTTSTTTPVTTPATTPSTTPESTSATTAATEAATERGADQDASIAVSERAKAEEQAAAEKAIAEREARLAEEKAALEEKGEAVAAKEEEIKEDRAAIAEEQKEAIQTEVKSGSEREARATPLFELMNPELPLARIVLVDLQTGARLRRSEINTIRPVTITDIGEAWVAVAGQPSATGGAVRLVRVPKSDYNDLKQGSDDVFADTMVWQYGSSVYAVAKNGADWVIGRFDPATLELKATSVPVSRWTFLSEGGGRLVAQGSDGDFLVLDTTVLTTVAEIQQ